MSKVIYVKMENFIDVLRDFKERKMDFILSETTYTKKITVKDAYTLLFNQDGVGDNRVLSLINKVRGDAMKFVKRGESIGDGYIEYFKLFNDIPKGVCCKIDVRSAYWETALKKNVITQTTDNYFKEIYANDEYKFAKQQRLKALGSLATTKKIQTYIGGKVDHELTDTKTEISKPVYIDICRSVDLLMKESSKIKGSCYYYWDCLFIDKEFSKDAIEFFKDMKYDVKVEETRLEFVDTGRGGYIVSLSDKKSYMVRSEDKHLIQYINEENNKEDKGKKVFADRFI